ncbi:hypothetical protein D0A37_18725 [Microcoleus vaginatus HSN003]|nr:hypothetical protein D0A37_18725 [Microcoleus vaginatus HSN003]
MSKYWRQSLLIGIPRLCLGTRENERGLMTNDCKLRELP